MITRSLQELFVDRLKQLERFRKSLEGSSSRQIILITAGPGMGKSWLLKQFAYEAGQRGVSSVLIDFSDGQAYDVLTLVRRFRDAIGPTHFNRMTAAINEATAPRLVISDTSSDGNTGVNFGSGQFGDVSIGDVAGRNIIKDNLFIVQTDNPLLLQTIEDRITQVFFECLSEIVKHTRLLFLFDTYERNSQPGDVWVPNITDRWITRELLTRIRDKRLPNTLAVLAGRRLPEFGAEWGQVTGNLPIDLFGQADVAVYLRENRGLSHLTDAEVQTLFNAVQGNPQLLGIIGDNLEQTTRMGEEEDW